MPAPSPASRALSRHRLPAALALSAALCAPALSAGFFGDDEILHAKWKHCDRSLQCAARLYELVSDDGSTDACRADGRCAWFSDPQMRLRLFRPLSSLLFAAELRWTQARPWLGHLASLLCWLAVLAAAGLLFRRLLPGDAGLAALFLFAVDPAHWMPIGWLANRHALLAALPSLLGLHAWLRAREDRWRPGTALALLGFALGLLAGETAVQALALPVAYELCGGPRAALPRRAAETWRGRLRDAAIALAPLLALLAIYLAGYRALGYGARWHDQYLDPIGEPLRFAGALLTRVPALLAELIGGLPSELSGALPALLPLAAALGLLSLAALLAMLRRALLFLEPGEARAVRWLALGVLLALVPGAAGPLGGRVLLISSLGSAAAIGAILSRARLLLAAPAPGGMAPLGAIDATKPNHLAARTRWALRLGLGWLATVHVVAAPLLLPLELLAFGRGGRWMERLAASAGALPGAEAKPDLLLLAAPDLITMLYPPLMFDLAPDSAGRSFFILSVAPRPLAFTRTGSDSFTLELLGGAFGESEVETFFRSRRHPLPLRQRVQLTGMSVELLTPSTLEVRAARPLEDPRLQLCQLVDGVLAPFPLPPPGERVIVPPPRGWLSR